MSDLQKELDTAQMNIKGYIAQLEATKQMLNEQLAASLQLRTNVCLMQQTNKELMEQIELNKKQLSVLAAKVLELTPKVADPAVQPNAA